MKKFEVWLNNQNTISLYSKNLFKEAIPCYRSEAFRSAFIVSYLGFLIAIRDRVLDNYNRKPSYLDETKWNQLITNLQNPDLWEKTLLTELNKADNCVFKLTDETRQSIQYWKNERNNAVHGKNTEINWVHAKHFLDFIMKNMPRFFIGGGDEFVKQMIRQNLEKSTSETDYSFTRDIEFLHYVYNRVEFDTWIRETYNFILRSQIVDHVKTQEFWKEFIINPDEDIFQSILSVAKDDLTMFLHLKNIIPTLATELYQDKIFVNNLIDHIAYYPNQETNLNLLIELYDSNIINDHLVDKCLQRYASSFHSHIENFLLHNPKVLEFLITHKYLDFLTNHIESKDMTDFVNAFYTENEFFFVVQFGEITENIYNLLKLYISKMYSTSSLVSKFNDLIRTNPGITDRICQYEIEHKLTPLLKD